MHALSRNPLIFLVIPLYLIPIALMGLHAQGCETLGSWNQIPFMETWILRPFFSTHLLPFLRICVTHKVIINAPLEGCSQLPKEPPIGVNN